MPIAITCPSCKAKMQVPDKWAGKKAKCPKCGKPLAIPASTPAPSSKSPSRSIRPPEIDVEPVLAIEVEPAPAPSEASPVEDDEEEQVILPRRPRKKSLNLLWIVLPLAGVIGTAGGLGVMYLVVNTPSGKQKAAAADAIKALGKVKAAVEVGVNNKKYSELVIDAKATVNEAKGTLPEGELSKCLMDAMDAYADARTVWDYKIQFGQVMFDIPLPVGMNVEYHKDLMQKYNLPIKTDEEASKRGQKNQVTDCDTAMQIIWKVARTKLDKARSLVK